MKDERLYTLAEARRELEREECTNRGHDFHILVAVGGDPYNITCGRCGRVWPVERAA